MKITYLASPLLPSTAAHSVHIMKMCQALSEVGHEVHLIGPLKSMDHDQDVWEFYDVDRTFEITYLHKPSLNIPYVPKIYSKGFGNVMNSALSVKEASQKNPDIVYTRNETTAYFACLAGLSTVYESHVPVPFEPLGSIREIIFKRLINRKEFRLLVVISESLREYYEENYDLESKEVVLARDAADPIDDSIPPIKFKNDKELQVGYIGNLYEGRGMDIIGEQARSCDISHFHIVGGDEENIKTWKKGLDFDNITFHGFIPQSDLDRYKLGFDVLLAPYQSELKVHGGQNTVKWMSPLKIFEYMATGKPILASDLPAIQEILKDGKTAFLCDPESPTEWIESLKKLRDPGLRKKLGENAKSEFMEKYTWKKRAENIIEQLSQKNE